MSLPSQEPTLEQSAAIMEICPCRRYYCAGGRSQLERRLAAMVGARMVRHGRYITFQLAEVAVSRQVFRQILARIAQLRAPPVPA